MKINFNNTSLQAVLLHALLFVGLLLQIYVIVPAVCRAFADGGRLPSATELTVTCLGGPAAMLGIPVVILLLYVDYKRHVLIAKRLGETKAWLWSVAVTCMISALQFYLLWSLLLPVMKMTDVIR